MSQSNDTNLTEIKDNSVSTTVTSLDIQAASSDPSADALVIQTPNNATITAGANTAQQSLTMADQLGYDYVAIDYSGGDNGTFNYKGELSDWDNHLVVKGFKSTNQFSFAVNPAYTDSNLYEAVYDSTTHLLQIIYHDLSADVNLGGFYYYPADSSQGLPQISVVGNSSDGYTVELTGSSVGVSTLEDRSYVAVSTYAYAQKLDVNPSVTLGSIPPIGVNADFSKANGNGILTYTGDITDISSSNLKLTNFSLTDQFVFGNVSDAYSDASRYQVKYDPDTGILTIDYVNEDGSVSHLTSFNYVPADSSDTQLAVLVTPNGDGTVSIAITKCFVTGTHILTPSGEVCVEDLREGDDVITLKDGKHVAQRIVWAGNMEVDVSRYENKDTLYPVRIKAHAFGLNQPCRDLLVTPEHTVYVNGGLIPARMLVNGRSIIIDRSMDSFTVYHIETEEHSILLSENLTTESYLNTDDRHQFNNGNAINLHLTFNEQAGHKNWEEHAAAPLMVARDQVEPIWAQLDRNATQQGYAPVVKAQTTRDPALCLITQHGETLQPVDVRGNAYSFYVPANVRVVAMRSRAGLPSEVVGPFVDDRRMLGVLVSKMSVLGEHSATVIPSDMSNLSGWYPAETGRHDRWTKGFATLPSAITEAVGKVKLIKIELTDTAEYFEDDMVFASKIA